MDAGNGKSSDFRLSQALTYPVVKKGLSAAAATGFFSIAGFSSEAGSPGIPF
jgi:hypothetical protein